MRIAIFICWSILAQNKTVRAYNFLLFRIPNYQLFPGMRSFVELIKIEFFASSTACSPECDLTQTPDFPKHIRRIMSIYHIYVIIERISLPQKLVLRKFLLQHTNRSGIDDTLHAFICFQVNIPVLSTMPPILCLF